MGWLAREGWTTLAMAVFLTLAQAVSAVGAVDEETSPVNRFVQAIEGMDRESQERALGEVREKLGLAPSPYLQACRETLTGYLMNALRSENGATLAALKEKAYAQCTKIIQIRDRNATLNDVNKSFADELAEGVFNQFKALTAAPMVRNAGFRGHSELAMQNVGSPGGMVPPPGFNPADTAPPPAGATAPAPGNAGVAPPPAPGNAGAAASAPGNPPVPGNIPAAGALRPLPPVLQLGTNRAQLKAAFAEQDAGNVKAFIDNMTKNLNTKMEPTADQRETLLRQWYESPPMPGILARASFPATFNEITGQNLVNVSQLDPADKQTIEAIIKEVLGQAPTPLGVDSKTTQADSSKPGQDGAVAAAEGAISVLGDFLPQFVPFEGLADEAVEYLVPRLERWRPFQRCFGRDTAGTSRGLFGTRSSRGVYYIEP